MPDNSINKHKLCFYHRPVQITSGEDPLYKAVGEACGGNWIGVDRGGTTAVSRLLILYLIEMHFKGIGLNHCGTFFFKPP